MEEAELSASVRGQGATFLYEQLGCLAESTLPDRLENHLLHLRCENSLPLGLWWHLRGFRGSGVLALHRFPKSLTLSLPPTCDTPLNLGYQCPRVSSAPSWRCRQDDSRKNEEIDKCFGAPSCVERAESLAEQSGKAVGGPRGDFPEYRNRRAGDLLPQCYQFLFRWQNGPNRRQRCWWRS